MDFQQWIGVGQSAAVTVAFLYITYHIPNMVTAYIAWRDRAAAAEAAEGEKQRQYDADERDKDRKARQDADNKYQKNIQEIYLIHKEESLQITAAINRMTEAINHICAYNRHFAVENEQAAEFADAKRHHVPRAPQ